MLQVASLHPQLPFEASLVYGVSVGLKKQSQDSKVFILLQQQ